MIFIINLQQTYIVQYTSYCGLVLCYSKVYKLYVVTCLHKYSFLNYYESIIALEYLSRAYCYTLFYFILDYMPDVQNYSYPEVYGMDGTRNFYIDTKDNITLGVW